MGLFELKSGTGIRFYAFDVIRGAEPPVETSERTIDYARATWSFTQRGLELAEAIFQVSHPQRRAKFGSEAAMELLKEVFRFDRLYLPFHIFPKNLEYGVTITDQTDQGTTPAGLSATEEENLPDGARQLVELARQHNLLVFRIHNSGDVSRFLDKYPLEKG
jgi:hypothetical protein